MFGLEGFQIIMIVSILLGGISVMISKFLTDQKLIKKLKKEMEFYQKKSKEAQKEGDIKKANEYMNEILKLSSEHLRENMKPMMISLIIFFLAFSWLGSNYSDVIVMSPFNLPFFGKKLNWFWWYFITIIPVSMFFRKILDVQ